MLFRHSLYYLLARGGPGLINFAALAVYSRLLAPDEFGRYALVLAGVGFANVMVFQWLNLVLSRFWAANENQPERFLGGILALFLALALAAGSIGILVVSLWSDQAWRQLLILALLLLVAQAWFELNLVLAQVQIKPAWYGKLLVSKTMVALGVGGILAWLGLGSFAPITGLIVAYLAAFLFFLSPVWRGISPYWPEVESLRAQLRYGLPLAVTFALNWVMDGSDRLLLGWLLDERAVGFYAAGYDLAFQSLTLLLTIINTAGYPLVLHALDKNGVEQARWQLGQNGELLITAAFVGVTMMIALAPQIIELIIGEKFRTGALLVFPWVALAAAISGIKAFHFDIAFHLKKSSPYLVLTGTIAAAVNVVLNLILIPAFGILGAAWATLLAYIVAFVTSAWLGRRVFPMPSVKPMLIKAGLIALLVGATARLGAELSEVVWVKLGTGLLLGLLMALCGVFIVDLGGLRRSVAKRWLR
jgi:O-antigen/teichoic acid export membrane protein